MKLFQKHISLNMLLLAAARKGYAVLGWCFEQGFQNFTLVKSTIDQFFRTSVATPLSIVNLIDSYNSDYAYSTQKMSLIPITVPIARGR